MVAFTKVNDFVEDCLNGLHNLSTDTLKLALSNTAPAAETSNPTADGNGILANVTQIAYTNVSGGQPTLASVSVSLSSGTVTLDAADEVILASGGSIPTFRYVYIYNDTAAADNLIGLYDNGSAISLADAEQVTLAFSGSGILTVA
jgi:hypothetical protein